MAMITCKEISQTIASDQLETAGWRRRLAIKIHLLGCRHCRRYAGQIRALGLMARRNLSGKPIDSGARERLRDSILARMEADEEKKVEPRE